MRSILIVLLTFIFVGCSENSSDKGVENKEIVKKEALKQEIRKNIPAAVEEKVVEKKVVENIQKTSVSVVTNTKTGASVFIKCSACHGKNAEKSALGKSKIIKGWGASKIAAAINGYKDGTYGGVMKGVMKGQASSLSDDDIKLVSEYISKL